MPTSPVVAPYWGVTVAHVVAVASQASVHNPEAAPREVANPVMESEPAPLNNLPQFSKTITTADVERWISRVGAMVATTLHRRSRLPVTAREEIESAMGTIVELGAAAYLVDAAYPQRAGVNDQASYGDVLWTRYRQALTDLSDALASRVAAEDSTTPGPSSSGGYGPPAVFTDQWVRENTDRPLPSTDSRRAPGNEYPRW